MSLFFSSLGFSSDGGFYTLNQKWEKENDSQIPRKEALDQSFASALQKIAPSSTEPNPPALPLNRSLEALANVERTIEIEQNQSLFIKAGKPIVKFVTTEDGKVTIETVDSNRARILGVGIGSTFVHIWTSAGRLTFEVRVIPQKFIPSPELLRQQEAIEKSRSFKIGYDNSRTASYNGSQFRKAKRSSVDFIQNANVSGDTPYGAFSSHVQTEKFGGKTLLTDAQVALNDGKIGSFRNFNAAAGDSRVVPDLFVFPGARIRGAEISHWDDRKRMLWDTFYGREQSSIIGTLTPGIESKHTRNSYLRGGVMDYQFNNDAKIKGGYFVGSGTSRADDLPNRGEGLKGSVNFGPHFTFQSEADADNRHTAEKEALTVRFDKINVRGEFRNINKNFETLIGAPGGQGELGTLLTANVTPFENVTLNGSLDVFRDRLIPNPEKPKDYNIHENLSLSVVPWEGSNALLSYQKTDDTARLGPTRQKTYTAQFNQRVYFLGHRGNAFAHYQNRLSEILNNSILNYQNDQITFGYQTQIFWGIDFSISEEVNFLDEFNVPSSSRPRALVYELNRSSQIPNVPLYYDLHLRIRDEEDTESINSFMSGFDTTEVSGGFYYRGFEGMEIFLTGSFQNYTPENLNTPDPRVEFQFLTGVRYLYDTKYRWSAVGSFDGYVYKDLNGDGQRQPGEPGLAGIPVRTTDNREISTDKEGYYAFKSVSGKSVTLILDNSKIPYGYAPTTSVIQQLPIEQGVTRHVDFGVTPRSEITGIVFNDLDGNGKYDVTDNGVRKVKIKLEGDLATRTNGLGVYSFPTVIAGDHKISLDLTTLPEGYLPEGIPTKTFTVFEGIRFEQNFPLRAVRQITGRVYVDVNNNKILDSDEKMLAGVDVLFGGKTVPTDKDGYFLFDSLASGSYELSVGEKTLQPGYSKPENIKIDLPVGPITLTDVNIAVKPTKDS